MKWKKKKSKKKKETQNKIFETIAKENNIEIIKELGEGTYGIVKEVIIKEIEKEKEKEKDDNKDKNTNNLVNKKYAAKLIKKSKKQKIDEADLILELRGPGIVKVTKNMKKK